LIYAASAIEINWSSCIDEPDVRLPVSPAQAEFIEAKIGLLFVAEIFVPSGFTISYVEVAHPDTTRINAIQNIILFM